MEEALTESSWLAGNEFSLADIGYARTSPASIICNCNFSGTSVPIFLIGTTACASVRDYIEALEKWFNSNCLPLMKEKGLEIRDKVKAIVAE